MNRTSLFIFLCLSWLNTLPAASPDNLPFPAFEKITTLQGLSNPEVYKVIQDAHGFLWFLTGNGLNRYDGYDFKVYDYNPSDSNSISAGFFYSLVEDHRGLLWMNSENQGIYSFNTSTGLFANYRNKPGNSNSLADDLTQCLAVDKSGYVWIGTMSGLDKLDPVTGQFTHFRFTEEPSAANRIYTLCLDEEDNLWMTTGVPGVGYFNTRTGRLARHFDFGSSQTPDYDWQLHPYGVSAGRQGNIWICSRDSGLYGYNVRTGKMSHILYRPGNEKGLAHRGVFKAAEDHAGNLWLATDAGTIDYYEKSSGIIYHRSLPGFDYVDVMEDAGNKIWITTMNGIYSCDTRRKKISQHWIDPESTSSNNYSCWSVYRTRSGALYAAYHGMSVFDSARITMKPFVIPEHGRNIFDNNPVWKINEDSKGRIWFGTINGMGWYDPVTRNHRWYTYEEGSDRTPSASSCTDILEDRKGRFWITTWGGGLDRFDPATGVFTAYKVNGTANSVSSNSLLCIIEARNGNLLVGSMNSGLMLFDPDKEQFRVFRHVVGDTLSLSNDIPCSMLESSSGIIWICTLGGGLNAFDPSTGKFRAFTVSDGLCSNSLVSITEDNSGRYWIGTFKGVSCFTPPANPFDRSQSFSFRNYDRSDGLADDKINVMASVMDHDGRMFFGTANGGIVSFYPDQLEDNDYRPPVVITGIQLFNKDLVIHGPDSILALPPEQTRQLSLNYNQNDFSFEFAALNYFHPEKNQYEYSLEGYDKTWIRTDASRRFANYTNLEPGHYVFRVRGSNNDGLWNPAAAEVFITIHPPFWKTTWFRVLLVLAVAAAAFAFYRYRIGQILLLQRIRNKIAADLHDDIGSTLNSISIYSEVARKDPAQQQQALVMIGDSARRIVESMGDIVWSINPENDTFDKIILRMRSLAYQMMKAKKIDFSFKADESLHELKLPMEKRRNFYLIYKEAVNNLVKYSQAERAAFRITHENRVVTCLVQDNGVGFDVSLPYNGNGLNNIRRRAREMEAHLVIDSQPGKGTRIEITLKI